MPDFPAYPELGELHTFSISTHGQMALPRLAFIVTTTATAWPSADLAIFVPFRLPAPATVYKMATGTGTGSTGNFDLGIYDSFGNKIVSAGSTAKTVASSERIIDVTDTLLHPGLYYLAMATDGTTAYQMGSTVNSAFGKLMGLRQMTSAFPLPATATYATYTQVVAPTLAAFLRSE